MTEMAVVMLIFCLVAVGAYTLTSWAVADGLPLLSDWGYWAGLPVAGGLGIAAGWVIFSLGQSGA